MTTALREVQELEGAPVYDREGKKIGAVEEIFTDDTTRQPQFIGIGTGFLRMSRTLVPVEPARLQDGALHVPYEKNFVKDSPDVSGDVIDAREARELYDYYGLETTTAPTREPTERGTETADVTRHEEEVRVGKRDVDAGSIRLRKWVETEDVDTTVELEHEEARVRRQPVDRPGSAAEVGEKEVEVPLREQEPVVDKDVVAKERVEIDKDVEREREPVSEEVRKERVEIDEDTR